MKPITKLLLLFIIAVTAVILWRMMRPDQATSLATIITANAPAPSYEPTENEGGDVTVSVTPLTLRGGFPPSFDIAFETHSVDLDFDVEHVATLKDTNGTTYQPIWQGSPPGGHHRSGTLRFTPDLPAQAGLPRSTTVTLIFKDIAGIAQRTFTWEVNP